MALRRLREVIFWGLRINLAHVAADLRTFATDLRGEATYLNAHVTSQTLTQVVVDSLGVSSRSVGSGDDDSELLPSTQEEIELTAAITAQSKIVSDASRLLLALQTKVNGTLEAQETARYRYKVACRVSKKVVDLYREDEISANVSQTTLLERTNQSLALGLELQADTATAKDASKSLAAGTKSEAMAASTYDAINETLEKAKQDLIAADTKYKTAAIRLENRSDDLQKAVDKLNELNDELVEAQAKTPLLDEANLTQAVHEQAEVVANMTDAVTNLTQLVNKSLKERGLKEQRYLAAQSLANASDAAASSGSTSLDDLRAQSRNTSKAVVTDTVQLAYTAAEMNQTKSQYQGLVQEVIRGRRPVQTATDAEQQAKIDYAKANVTLQTFQEALNNQTSLVQKAVAELNVLNDRLRKVQDMLSRSG